MKNKKIHLIIPVLIINFILFSVTTSLMSEKSDIAVFIGFSLFIAAAYGNYFLIKYITKKKTK